MASQATAQKAQQAAQMLEAVANAQDHVLDKQIEDLQNMKEDDLEALRARRRQNMMKEQEKNRQLRGIGHGQYDELPNQEEFFAAVKKSTQMVVHFYRGSTERCKIVDARIAELVPRFIKTRFCKIDAEKAPFLVERLNIFMMPTLLLVKDCATVHQIRGLTLFAIYPCPRCKCILLMILCVNACTMPVSRRSRLYTISRVLTPASPFPFLSTGFDELGGTDEFSADYLAYVLSGHGVCNYDGPPPAAPTEKKMNIFQMPKSSIRQSAYTNDSDDDFSD
jgi:hypothetical protein